MKKHSKWSRNGWRRIIKCAEEGKKEKETKLETVYMPPML